MTRGPAPRPHRPFPRLAPLALAALILCVGMPGAGAQEPAPGMDRDALFHKAFGNKKKEAKARQLDLPVRFDGRELGLVPARVAADPKESAIDLGRLADLLAPVAQDAPRQAMRAMAGPDGYGRPGTPAPDTIGVAVDPGDLVVTVTIPPALRKRQALAVLERGDAARGYLVVPQADISAYVNARAALDYLQVPDGFGETGLLPLNAVFEPALNIRGWVLEGEAYYREDGDLRWSRGATRLVRDWTGPGIRAQFGDVAMPVVGPQVGRSLGGLSVARNFGLQPYRAVQPAGQREFILEAPSTVEVLVNGRPSRTFRLEPGPYSLGNFPGTAGTNDVTIRITDQFGRQQTIDFPFFFDSQLLASGVQEFGYTLGVPSRTDRDRVLYDRDRPTFSGFHRVGVSDRLTLGLGLQADRTQQLLSAEALLATTLGTFSLEPAASFMDATGSAVTLRFRDYRTGQEVWDNRTVTAQLGWRDGAYRGFGSTAPGDTGLDAAFRVGQPITTDLSATLGGRWRESRSAMAADTYSVDLALRRRLFDTGSADITLSRERNSDGSTDTGLFLSFRMTFSGGEHSAGATVDTISREQRLDWRYQTLRPVDSLTASLDAVNVAGANDRVQGSLGYVHPRFQVGARHDAALRQLGGQKGMEHRSQVNLATALAFADGKVGVSRPITNSFAIVVPHPRLKGREVGVDPVNGNYLARTDWLGLPVVPNISPYLVRPLLLDVPDAPATYDLGEDRPAVQPGYRSGTLVPIGTDATAALDGMLKAPDGTPVALLSGVLRPLDGAPAKEVQFFTNRKGRFRVEGLRPGKWELAVFGLDAMPFPIDIPAEADGVIQLGEVRLHPPR